MGIWEFEDEEVWDYLNTPDFQKGFVTAAAKKLISVPPRRTSAQDSWLDLVDDGKGKKIAVREHMQLSMTSKGRTCGARRNGHHGG